jgi:hypothetical protein
MNHFDGDLYITPRHNNEKWDGLHWIVTSPFSYTDQEFNQKINIPSGFITDGASSPRFVIPVVSQWGKHGRASVIHDWLYRYKPVDRKTADKMFVNAMKLDGVVKWKIFLIHFALQMFGKFSWKSTEKYLSDYSIPK